jgi:signal transduction histidine kinase/phage shock protein PspC (stress-responsive transcriptional regulator)
MVAGVLAGFARRFAIDPVLARIGFVVLVVATGGIGLIAYGVAWALMPSDAEPRPAGEERVLDSARRKGLGRLAGGWRIGLGVGLLTLAALLAFRELGIWWSDALVWPVVLAAGGAALLWRQSRGSSEEEMTGAPAPVVERNDAAGGIRARERASTPHPRSQFSDLYRGGFGVALVVGAALLFLSSNNALGAARDAALTAVVAVVALALILAPFLWQLGRRLAAEKDERVRSQERAEVAAHLHDSVLQTLTLMQKRADDPREVATLARRQERELRSWLFGSGSDGAATFSSALQATANEVEDAHSVAIEVVAVGEGPLDERAEAVVGAAREALTNAAKFAGEETISVYAEVDEDRIQVFVHDRGPGFELAAVPADRRGVRESIIGRMERHGGRAEVRARPGEGTEVELVVEREPQ